MLSFLSRALTSSSATRIVTVSRQFTISRPAIQLGVARLTPLITPPTLIPVRWTTYGQEYQPSSIRRRRKFGYLARLRSRGGRKILMRRIMKGRKYLAA
jgi:large subunit ribosomal protein L34